MVKSFFVFAFVVLASTAQVFAKGNSLRVVLFDATEKSGVYDFKQQQQTLQVVREAWQSGFIPAIELTPELSAQNIYRLRSGTVLTGSGCAEVLKVQLQSSEWGHRPMEMMAKEFWQLILENPNILRAEVVLMDVNLSLAIDDKPVFANSSLKQNFLQKVNSEFQVIESDGVRSCR